MAAQARQHRWAAAVGQAPCHGAQFRLDRPPHHRGQGVGNHPVELALDVDGRLRHIHVGRKLAQVLGFMGHGGSAGGLRAVIVPLLAGSLLGSVLV